MRGAFLILIAALAACQNGDPGSAPVAPDAPEAAPVVSVVLVPADAQMESLLRAADAQWEAAGVDPDAILVAPAEPGGSSRWIDGGAAEMDSICHAQAPAEGHRLAGCALQSEGAILIDSHVMAFAQLSIVAHEMGHLIAGRDHITHLSGPGCPEGEDGAYLMCAQHAPVLAPTPLDVAFVTTSAEALSAP